MTKKYKIQHGTTYPHKEKLKQMGMMWDPKTRSWWTCKEDVIEQAKEVLPSDITISVRPLESGSGAASTSRGVDKIRVCSSRATINAGFLNQIEGGPRPRDRMSAARYKDKWWIGFRKEGRYALYHPEANRVGVSPEFFRNAFGGDTPYAVVRSGRTYIHEWSGGGPDAYTRYWHVQRRDAE